MVRGHAIDPDLPYSGIRMIKMFGCGVCWYEYGSIDCEQCEPR